MNRAGIKFFSAAAVSTLGFSSWFYSPTLTEPINSSPFSSYSTRGTLADFKNKYRVGDKLGSGTFAVVKRGVDIVSKEPVAIKEIDKSRSEEAARAQEVEIMEKMGEHPSLIRLRDVFESEDVLFIIQDLADSGELFDMIINKGELSEKEAARYFRQAVEAIDHLHRNNIVHLDIKPENLLLKTMPDNPEQKILCLADFGLAVEEDPKDEFNLCVGTPAYWAPEMVKHETYGRSVDIWALGNVLYILLCGIHPFDPSGESPEAQILARVAVADYDKNSREFKSLSNSCKDLLRHLLDIDKSRRYTTKQILEHPWLNSQVHSTEPMNISKLRGFRILTFIKTGMRDLFHQAEDDLFDALDVDKNGFVCKRELTEGLRNAGFEVSDVEIEAFMDWADADGDAMISRKEFKDILNQALDHTASSSSLSSLEDLNVLFNSIDKDGDGYIKSEDVLHVVSLLGYVASSTVVSKEWRNATESNDGLVNFAEFVKKVRIGEKEKRNRNDGVAGSSSILKLRDQRDWVNKSKQD